MGEERGGRETGKTVRRAEKEKGERRGSEEQGQIEQDYRAAAKRGLGKLQIA